MKSVWDTDARNELYARLDRLKADTRPGWGKMDAAQMMGHCADGMRAALGELQVTDKKSPFRFAPVRYLVIYWLPWPQGAPTAPELIHEGKEDFSKNRAELKGVMERLAVNRSKGLRPHAAFGQMTEKDWGCLTWRHVDHHLRQFGL